VVGWDTVEKFITREKVCVNLASIMIVMEYGRLETKKNYMAFSNTPSLHYSNIPYSKYYRNVIFSNIWQLGTKNGEQIV